MIVLTGESLLLAAQANFLSNCYAGLYTNNYADDIPAAVLADLTEAAWGGYLRRRLGTQLTPTSEEGLAKMQTAVNPLFLNSSGSTQQFYGWFVVDPSGTILVAYHSVTERMVQFPSPGRYQLSLAALLRGL